MAAETNTIMQEDLARVRSFDFVTQFNGSLDKLTEQNKTTNVMLEKERKRNSELEKELAGKGNNMGLMVVVAIAAAIIGFVIANCM